MRKEPIITSKNYHVATEANWTSVEKNDLGIENYKSSSGSKYWYTNDGVYRLSNHGVMLPLVFGILIIPKAWCLN